MNVLLKAFVAVAAIMLACLFLITSFFNGEQYELGTAVLFAGIIACLAITVYAAWKTSEQNSVLKTTLIGGVFAAALFVLAVLAMHLPSSLKWLLSDVGFGCTESYPLPYVNFEFAPWFCGELLRAVGDGFLAGALVFLLTAASRKTRIKPRA